MPRENKLHIILVSDRMAKARSIQLTWRHFVLAIAGFLALVVTLSSLFSYVTVRHAAQIHLPFLQDLLRATNDAEAERSKTFLRDNLNAMAVKLGQMQAQLIRIDSIGARLSEMAGLKHDALKGGQGGPLVDPSPLSAADLQNALLALSRRVETTGDSFSLLESRLLEERVRKSMLPTTLPVRADWISAGFGWRIDPFTGLRAMHEGVDFAAEVGTPIVAAASGVVITAEPTPDYGNLVEIDHGNGITTRYAHASKLYVKVGQLVRRGQKIAVVGTTGRSTGPHLHFEVRENGVAVNPNSFLQHAEAATHLARR
ncbi:murein DD-endopeptidase MepM [mine drainage metagenome]|uniref:Murein DD-endopeptidase MepM n=1 Tax=mine drainage metagenome TaxID=410659 RepID=A0A1J5RK42_9ZZZZ